MNEDGLELDWMRHGYHFAPGREDQGREHLNAFMERVRWLLGKRKRIGVRVPPHPDTALRMGMDAVTWSRAGFADLVVPTNFWRTVDTGMPIRPWRQLLPAITIKPESASCTIRVNGTEVKPGVPIPHGVIATGDTVVEVTADGGMGGSRVD